ncbi:MAG: alkaline phosphatase family protein [bacterium]
MARDKPRVIVIGLDGATFKNIKPWMEQGFLPNLKFLVDNGVSGELESTLPRNSAPAWSSFMTGVNPGKHGIFGFAKPFRDKNYKREVVSARDIKAKTIFEILSDNQKKSIIINLPMTYPPFKLNGCMISCGLLTPSTDFNFTYPNDLFNMIEKKKEEYILDVHPKSYSDEEKEKLFADLIQCAVTRKEISFQLMSIIDWDLCMVVFTGTDRLQHFYWHCIDSEHPKYNPIEAQKLLPLIIRYFQKLDSIIGEYMNHLDENTSLLIMSDHGFGPLNKYISLHNILKKNNLLYYKASHDNSAHKKGPIHYRIRGWLHDNVFLYRKAKEIINNIYPSPNKKLSSQHKLEDDLKIRLVGRDQIWQKIDWQRTIAYFGPSENTIYLNLKGREPEGIVEQNDEYIKRKEQIINIINNLHDVENKKKLKVKFYEKERIYTGPQSSGAPDLIFEIEDNKYVLAARTDVSEIFVNENEKSGSHTQDGLLICYGNNFKNAYHLKDARIIDCTPTILYLLKNKISEYIDGKVLTCIFKEEFIKNNPIDFVKISQDRQECSSNGYTYSEEDEEMLKKRLTDLGYL